MERLSLLRSQPTGLAAATRTGVKYTISKDLSKSPASVEVDRLVALKSCPRDCRPTAVKRSHEDSKDEAYQGLYAISTRNQKRVRVESDSPRHQAQRTLQLVLNATNIAPSSLNRFQSRNNFDGPGDRIDSVPQGGRTNSVGAQSSSRLSKAVKTSVAGLSQDSGGANTVKSRSSIPYDPFTISCPHRPLPSGPKEAYESADTISQKLTEEDRLLLQLEEKGVPWGEIASVFQDKFGLKYQIPALQVRHRRLREKMYVWTEPDVKALRLAHDYWVQSRFEIIRDKMPELGGCKITARQCARKWAEVDPLPTPYGSSAVTTDASGLPPPINPP